MAISWDHELSPEQNNAASHEGAHARLLAGPGTGKTKTLIARIARLVGERGVDSTQIIALTFTRVAAADLSRKVRERLADGGVVLPRISTLHSFALRQILRNAARTNLPQPVRIADDFEERWIVAEEISSLIDADVRDTQKLFQQLSSNWEGLTPDWQVRFPHPQFLGAWQEHRQVYGYTLRSELVYQLKLTMDERPVDLEGPPRYLLVDEYQDLNACDLAVIQSLSRQGCEIYAAGDDDQSIYGFRYANPYGIRRFPDEYVPHALLELNVCQRCGQGILDYALYVAMQDHRRIEKPIHAKPDAPVGQVHVLGFPNQYQEARGIAKICKWLIGAQGILPKDVLVLLRSDRNEVFSGPIRDALTNVQVPVSIASDPLALFNTSPGRQVIAMLRLVHDLTDDLAWRSILATRKNGLSETAFAGLYDLSRRLGRRYSVTLQEVLAEPRLVPRMGGRIAREVTAVGEIVRRVGPPTEGDLQGWLQALITATLGPDEAGPHVLALLLRLGGTAEADTLEGILKSVALSLGEVEQERQSDAVSIMTMHQAKGLTARAVVVAAAEDEYLPGKAQGEEIDDERRLLYVSLTRAMTHLYVTFCNRRFGRQRRTGRTAGEGRTDRTFTTFLRGGPVTPVDGQGFTTSLGT